MSITIAKTAGFCFGVDRAVELVYKLIHEERQVSTIGPIIHNPQLVKDLENKGVSIIDTPSEASENDIVVIRSHGVSKNVYDELKSLGYNYCDATCPFVSKIHKIVSKKSEQGCVVFIAGDENHPEVIGIRGHCNDQSFVFKDEKELENIPKEHPEICNK
ncbi:MAG: hydroxymethylbutenyl pyrophosphate reductase, partial [Oscillospiraceae bacterium]|nr:hydroxymethylbutenyl pyrophosphate reductase [Oscillospiraceae bacterium]